MSDNNSRRVVSITPTGDQCRLHLYNNETIDVDLSVSSLEVFLAGQEFPTISELIERKLMVAYPMPLRMTAPEWAAISKTLQSSPEFRSIMDRFPKLVSDIHQSYWHLMLMPHRLYGGVGVFHEGQGMATLYTSLPLDFRTDEQLGNGWYHELLSSGEEPLVVTRVNVKTHKVAAKVVDLPWHYVTNANAKKPAERS